jgi:hypothetical protein
VRTPAVRCADAGALTASAVLGIAQMLFWRTVFALRYNSINEFWTEFKCAGGASRGAVEYEC